MNKKYLKTAKELRCELKKSDVVAVGRYGVIGKNEPRIFDLGNYCVGKVRLKLSALGVFDAPVLIKFFFAETKTELDTDVSNYNGTLSGSWIQKEIVHVDALPCVLRLPRRYACRFIRMEILAKSPYYAVSVDKLIFCETTSAKREVEPIGKTEKEKKIDAVALRTLRSCMQDEFEDGPKRDRRLWLGDLRIQALVNYVTYQNYDLVKRCLYLFAGTADEDGRVSGSVFMKPKIYVNGGKMFDYPMLFAATLLEYLDASGDEETAKELFPLALRQAELLKDAFDENGMLNREDKIGWCFIDWDSKLDKLACGHAVYIYGLKITAKLCERLGESVPSWLCNEIVEKSKTAKKYYYDELQGLFVDKDGKTAYVQNAWFCLAELFPKNENKKILQRLRMDKNATLPVTPYGYHYYVQALCECGETEEAKRVILAYWGKMADMQADTFFEVFDPEDPTASPYGSAAINSYCHAWSCSPSYFYRKYGL